MSEPAWLTGEGRPWNDSIDTDETDEPYDPWDELEADGHREDPDA